MKLVIELDENIYNEIKNNSKEGWLTAKQIECMDRAICNGIPLPKRHGDLIDRNSILCDDCSCEQCGHTDECFKLLAPTIIEADKENKE